MIIRRTVTESLNVADLASREHAIQALGAHRLLEQLAALPISDQDGLTDLEKVLPTILGGFPQFANLGVLGLDGSIAYSVVAPPHQVNMFKISAFQEALKSKGVAVGTYLVGPIVERPILIMTHSLHNAKGQVRFVLFAALDLDWLDRLAKQASLPPDSALLIVDRAGTILASSLPGKPNQDTNKHLKGFKQLILNPNTLTRCEAPDGIARLAVAIPLKGMSDLWVVAGPPEASVHTLANHVFYRDITVLALLALFAIGSSLLATDLSVLHDLRMLAAATHRFGTGDLSARAPVPRPHGEIRDLTSAFNSMAETLELRDREAVLAQEHLRALSHSLLTAREEEAARIAQELHDELGQELSVLRLELEHLRRKVSTCVCATQSKALTIIIDELGESIDAAVHSVRRIASELRPGVLDQLGLVSGLEWLLNEFERRTEIHTTIITTGVEKNIDADISTALFRITQEALTNIARHAGASSVETRLSGTETALVLCVKDDGSGFNPTEKSSVPSLGLLGMRERAWRLGGTVNIISVPGQGTELLVTIPRSGLLLS